MPYKVASERKELKDRIAASQEAEELVLKSAEGLPDYRGLVVRNEPALARHPPEHWNDCPGTGTILCVVCVCVCVSLVRGLSDGLCHMDPLLRDSDVVQ